MRELHYLNPGKSLEPSSGSRAPRGEALAADLGLPPQLLGPAETSWPGDTTPCSSHGSSLAGAPGWACRQQGL